jgi:uncharacterized protein YjbJ (UPF0337 family)
MSGTTDVVKGRIKEAAGALTNDDKLREEGQTDQVTGKVQQGEAAQKAAHEAKVAAEKAKVAAEQAVHEAKDDTNKCATGCE